MTLYSNVHMAIYLCLIKLLLVISLMWADHTDLYNLVDNTQSKRDTTLHK
jgi:hypothetical protein